MTTKTHPLYQGRDWISNRWTVAEAFDSLDRLYDLCLCHGWTESPPAQDNQLNLSTILDDISDDLGAQLIIVYADTLSPNRRLDSTPHRWKSFETDQLFNGLKTKITLLSENDPKEISSLLLSITALKNSLKQIDL